MSPVNARGDKLAETESYQRNLVIQKMCYKLREDRKVDECRNIKLTSWHSQSKIFVTDFECALHPNFGRTIA